MAALLLMAGTSVPAFAASCKSSGGLTYLGNTRDASRSVWLSRTDPGSFLLEAAQGGQAVDNWAVPPSRRLHLSTSPVVSTGNGGTHKLYETSDNKPCLIDTHNQKRDFKLPNFTPPGQALPPIGNFFPDFGGLMPTRPSLPSLPGGVQPPIGTLPPTGVMPSRPTMPTLPGAVQPPIATLPPTGVMPSRPTVPTLPGGVQPPIATLPPTGVMPSRPTVPTLPGGVQPPIGTLPPTGVMPSRPTVPTLPGAVQPPIGTLPPTGVMPSRPTVPTLPGAVQPPIGTLPPTGVMPSRPTVPTLPGGVQPPIATLPPTGVMPGVPVRVPPSVVTLPPVGQRNARLAAAAGSLDRCIDPRTPTAAADRQVVDVPVCPQEILAEVDALRGTGPAQVPLTEGRDLGQPTLWNVWAEGLVVGISDERYGLDMSTTLGTGTLGIDRRLNDDVVLGVSFSVQNSSTDGFDDFLHADTDGFSFGPYLAVRLSPHWAVDASLTYGQYDNDVELAILSGSYTSRQYGGSVNLHGQYMVDEVLLRPKASISYSHIESDGYDMTGTVLGLPVSVEFPADDFNYGVFGASTEISRIFSFSDGTQMMPFAEIGAQYEFERPHGGEILTGDLSMATPSPWSGSIRTGVRALIKGSVQVEASAGYLSFGQNGLDVWEGKLHVSYGF